MVGPPAGHRDRVEQRWSRSRQPANPPQQDVAGALGQRVGVRAGREQLLDQERVAAAARVHPLRPARARPCVQDAGDLRRRLRPVRAGPARPGRPRPGPARPAASAAGWRPGELVAAVRADQQQPAAAAAARGPGRPAAPGSTGRPSAGPRARPRASSRPRAGPAAGAARRRGGAGRRRPGRVADRAGQVGSRPRSSRAFPASASVSSAGSARGAARRPARRAAGRPASGTQPPRRTRRRSGAPATNSSIKPGLPDAGLAADHDRRRHARTRRGPARPAAGRAPPTGRS